MIEKLRALRDRVRNGKPRSPALEAYLEKVKDRAWTITDEEVASLLAGHDEDEVFEATVETALDSGIDRFAAGLRAIAEAKK